ncbi:MAG: tetratricopeptide repeat-containing sensor histidine kinase [Bacteroidetes bacterium]|nr:tetratricopeptide repeat-containing sensor histidine kinase [Bacteroidota bacterium]
MIKLKLEIFSRFKQPSKIIFLFIAMLLLNIAVTNATVKENWQDDSLQIEKWKIPLRLALQNDLPTSTLLIDSILSLSEKSNYSYGIYTAHNFSGYFYWQKNQSDTALYYYREALRFAKKSGNVVAQTNAYANMAFIHRIRYNNDSVMFYLEQAIEFSKNHNLSALTAENLITLSYLKVTKGEYTDAAKVLFEAQKITEETSDNKLHVMVYSAQAFLENVFGNFETVKAFYLKAAYYDKLDTANNRLPSIYLNLGENYWSLEENADSSLHYLKMAIAEASGYEKKLVQHAVDVNIGNIHLSKNQIDSALYYYYKAYENPLTNQLIDRKAGILSNLGSIYYKTGQIEKARNMLLESYKISDSLELVEYGINALGWLIKIDSTRSDFNSAFARQKKLLDLNIEQQKENARTKLAELEVMQTIDRENKKYELLYAENELKAKQLEFQRNVNYIYFIVVLGSIVFTLIQVLNRRKIQKLNKTLQSNQNELKTLNDKLSDNIKVLNENQIQLSEANKSKDKLFAILSHDLKSPFSSLLGILNILANEWNQIPEDEKLGLFESLHQASKGTFNLLEDMLSWSKTQQGLISSNPIPVNVAEIAQEIESLFRSSLNNKSLTLKKEIDNDLIINTDYHLLKQIIQNLVANAIKYTPRGGELILRSTSDNSQIKIDVIDTGIGIPKDKIDSIFTLDADFNRPGTENEKSTGMGLILCKEYANIIEARLTIASMPDQGSTFSIRFPKK